MKSLRSRLSNMVILVSLVGLAVAMIAIFNSLGVHSAGPSTSPVPTVRIQVSPVATPISNGVPLARIGAPIAVTTSDTAPNPGQDRDVLLSIIGQGEQSSTMLIDLPAHQRSSVANKPLQRASISGHRVVYEDRPRAGSPGSNSWIKILDLDTRQEISLGSMDAYQQEPSISGNIVVWTDWQNWDHSEVDIYGYDVNAGTQFPVVTGPGIRRLPTVSGQWVMYVQRITSTATSRVYVIELHARSLKTGEDFLIGLMPSPDNASWGTQFAVDGDQVLWVKANDASASYSEVHLYNLSTRADRKLTESTNQTPMDVSFSSASGILAYNTPSGRWTILDWTHTTPVSITVALPVASSINPLIRASGNYLTWQYADGKIYVAPVSR
jgi:hypothetical protein